MVTYQILWQMVFSNSELNFHLRIALYRFFHNVYNLKWWRPYRIQDFCWFNRVTSGHCIIKMCLSPSPRVQYKVLVHADCMQMMKKISCEWARLVNLLLPLGGTFDQNIPGCRFMLNLDIAAPKITIPTEFRPDDSHSSKLMLDLGNLVICSQVSAQTWSWHSSKYISEFHVGNVWCF